MLSEKQSKIFNGLKEIGEEISSFCFDAVKILVESSPLKSKANLIAHLAREIDSGLREVFAPNDLKVLKEKELGKDAGHFASILVALGREPSDPLAKKWHSIATKFAGVAHHRRAYMPAKDVSEIVPLWKEYEEILEKLIGSFYGMSDRLKQFTLQDNVSS